MAFDAETAHTLAPVLKMIGQEAHLDPAWTCGMLDAVVDDVLIDYYRNRRETAASAEERLAFGLKLVCGRQVQVDDIARLAHLFAEEEALSDAIYWIDKAIKISPENGELHRFKASIHERMGNFELALPAAFAARENGADSQAMSADIERIRQIEIASIRMNSRSKDPAASLAAFAELSDRGKLQTSDRLAFLVRAIKVLTNFGRRRS
jgi:hypothetical protein